MGERDRSPFCVWVWVGERKGDGFIIWFWGGWYYLRCLCMGNIE